MSQIQSQVPTVQGVAAPASAQVGPATARLISKHHVSEAEVRMIESPEYTDTWVPIAHKILIDEVDTALKEMSLEVDSTSRQFGIQRDGGQMFGVYHLVNHDSTMIDSAGKPMYSLALGLRNSVDKSLAAGILFGARIFVCDNLSFVGEKSIARKHTLRILEDIPVLIRQALSEFGVFKAY